MVFGKVSPCRLRSLLSQSSLSASESSTSSRRSNNKVNSVKPVPYTIYEALHGTIGLEGCVSDVTYSWDPLVRARLSRFVSIMNRPKQALQHILELLILSVCTLGPEQEDAWVSAALNELFTAAELLIPPVASSHANQWSTMSVDSKGRPARNVPQVEECYSNDFPIDATGIVRIIATFAPALPGEPIPCNRLAGMTGLMDEPAKSAVMVYAWFLANAGIPNGWLRPYLAATLGRRELLPRLPLSLSAPPDTACAGGRLARSGEELHTLYAPPFTDRLGHLLWYTVRAARPGEVIGRPATSYARANAVRIHSSMRLSRSVQIHPSHICNSDVLDWRLWLSWTHGYRATGSFKSLAADSLSPHTVAFDKPVRIECALAVGFRVVQGSLINPSGKKLVVIRHSESLFKAKAHSCRGTDRSPIPWSSGMLFA